MALKETLQVDFVEKELIDIELIEKELISIEIIEKITTPIEVDLIDKELINVNLVDKELVEIILNAIDILPGYKADFEAIMFAFVFNEIPTKINSKMFRTNHDVMTGTLRVFLNGIKEKYITIVNSNTFKFLIDTVLEDDIEVNYIKS